MHDTIINLEKCNSGLMWLIFSGVQLKKKKQYLTVLISKYVLKT